MVCIPCFIAPVVLFIWYKFIYPFLQPLINRWIGDYQLPQPFANLSCPLPQKKIDDKKKDSMDERIVNDPCCSLSLNKKTQ